MNKKRMIIYGVVIAIALGVGFFQLRISQSASFSQLHGQWVGAGTVATQEAGGKIRVTINKDAVILADPNIPITVEYKIKKIQRKHIKPTVDLGHGGSVEYILTTDQGEIKILQEHEKQLDYIKLYIYEDGRVSIIPLNTFNETEES